MEQYPLVNDTENKRYLFRIGDLEPRIEYIRAKEKIYLTHTEVPPELEGRGIAGQLVRAVLRDIEEQELTLIPLCPYVAGYIRKHPEWKKLVMKGIHI